MSLVLPERFRQRILRVFGPAGGEWLRRLPEVYAGCIARWQLSDMRPSRVLSHSLVCFGRSPHFGDVVLKVGLPDKELYTEMAALQVMRSPSLRRCYADDAGLGAMLLEYVTPGDDLRSVSGSRQRTAIAAGLIAATPQPWRLEFDAAVEAAGGGRGAGFPRLGEWTGRAFARVRREGNAPAQMLDFVDEAERLLPAVELPGMPLCVVHGDLNHWNMLLGEGGAWRVIDPKGAVTVGTYEAGRFVINELGFLPRVEWPSALAAMAGLIGAALDEPPPRVLLCAFVDRVLSTCWSYEEGPGQDRSADLAQAGAILAAYRSSLG